MQRLWLLSYFAAWALAVAQALVAAALVWGVGRIHLRRGAEGHALITDEGPPVHSAMPEIEGWDADGRPVRTSDYRGRQVVVLLVSPECAPCERLLRSIAATRAGLLAPPDFVVIMEAARPRVEADARRYRLGAAVIADEGASVRQRLGVQRTPYGFLVDSEGLVRMKGVVHDRGQLEALIRRRGRHIGALSWHTPHDSEDRLPAAPGATGMSEEGAT